MNPRLCSATGDAALTRTTLSAGRGSRPGRLQWWARPLGAAFILADTPTDSDAVERKDKATESENQPVGWVRSRGPAGPGRDPLNSGWDDAVTSLMFFFTLIVKATPDC